MLINRVRIENHPGIGTVELNFCDSQGTPFNIIIIAGSNGTGKTVVLNAIQEIFEAASGQRAYNTVLDITLTEYELNIIEDSIRAGDNYPSSLAFTIRYEFPSAAGWAGYTIEWISDAGEAMIRQAVLGDDRWQKILKGFLNQAAVNFNTDPIKSITSLDLVDVDAKSTRSGPNLGKRIAQLIADIRAADAEDLAGWVETHPQLAPPQDVIERRFSRFRRAFEYMFPSKRFKKVVRTSQGISLEFEDFGRSSTLDDLSTGEKQIAFRAGFMLQYIDVLQDSVVLMDEPELSLHPDWQEKIVSFYVDLMSDGTGKHPQFFIATHSPFIVHGTSGARVVILEKDQATGSVSESAAPSYVASGTQEAIRAFNIDAFLAAAQKPLLILTEGETDVEIIKTAWTKLFPGVPQPFELRAALGKKNINITLNDREIFSKIGMRKIVGLFDFDDAFMDWNGVWSAKTGGHNIVVPGEADGLTKRHSSQAGWAMLLPVPGFRSEYASKILGAQSLLSVEFMFEDKDIPGGMVGQKPQPMNSQIPFFKAAQKTAFAGHVGSLPAPSFAAFGPLFARWQDILSGAL